MKRVRSKQIKKTLKNENLITMFNQMMGEGDIDVNIVTPKYELILLKLNNISQTIRQIFIDSIIPIYVKNNFEAGLNNFVMFYDEINKDISKFVIQEVREELTQKKRAKLNSDPKLMEKYLIELDDKYDRDELKEAYLGVKECTSVGKLIIAAKAIKNALKNSSRANNINDLEVVTNLSSNFILNSSGDFLELIPSITILDFKQLFIDENVSPTFKERILFLLYVINKHTMVIIEQITSPDINISDFAKVFIDNLDQIKKIPELRKCSDAFNRISNSVELLETNFGTYYKSFATSKNPSVIIENFVLDVANTGHVDLKLKSQFMRIVNYYRKQMKGVSDPRINTMLDLVVDNLKIIDE